MREKRTQKNGMSRKGRGKRHKKDVPPWRPPYHSSLPAYLSFHPRRPHGLAALMKEKDNHLRVLEGALLLMGGPHPVPPVSALEKEEVGRSQARRSPPPRKQDIADGTSHLVLLATPRALRPFFSYSPGSQSMRR